MNGNPDVLSVMITAASIADRLGYADFEEKCNRARATVERIIRENEHMAIERRHLRLVNDRLVRLLSAIHMRCAPKDIKTEDGRTMRFVPPDPEFYWRELSAKVNGVMDEMRAINESEDAAAIAAFRGEQS